MTDSTGGSTHAQRRKAKQVKSLWTSNVVSGSHSLADLVEASQGDSEEARYLCSILLVDLVAAVHPALTRGQIISELEPLPIKLPADPARFSIRSIRSRPEVVAQVDAMLRASTVTKRARGRTDVPAEWPWGTKLSTLIRLNAGEMPQGLDFLEGGAAEDVDPGDLLLAAPDAIGIRFDNPDQSPPSRGQDPQSWGHPNEDKEGQEALQESVVSQEKLSPESAHIDEETADKTTWPPDGSTVSLSESPESGQSALSDDDAEEADDDPLAALEMELGLTEDASDEPSSAGPQQTMQDAGASGPDRDEPTTEVDVVEDAFADIFGES